eukprot:gb/GEZN01000426.1/.p1 GENE.gb/GEZN01000426.1/~~gb/GEZN01000426.1/.p1  ORF type:complete len:1268 (+),score=118.32 gb/GEZN01000426.1/:298-4101(+)
MVSVLSPLQIHQQKKKKIIKKTHSFAKAAQVPTPYVTTPSFAQMLEEAALLLPNQAILENFVHHNPYHHFEHMDFKDALNYAHKLELYMSPGERLHFLSGLDPRKRSNEAMAELSAVFLDRGSAKWASPHRDKGFLHFFASLEGLGFAPWRKQARTDAKRILAILEEHPYQARTLAETVVKENLHLFGIPPSDWTSAIRALLLDLRGWAGMFRRMETHPSEAPPNAAVHLADFVAVQSIIQRSSMEALARQSGWDGNSFAAFLSRAPVYRQNVEKEYPSHPSALAYGDQTSEQREALEAEFQDALLSAIGTNPVPARSRERPTLQLYTCIDDRVCSFRRHVENTNPSEIETFGVAGFFGIPFRFQPADGKDQMILGPEGCNPQALVTEVEVNSPTEYWKSIKFNQRRRFLAHMMVAWENASFSPVGSLFLSMFIPFSMGRLFLLGYAPNLRRVATEALQKALIQKPQTDFQLPFTPELSAALLARTFKEIGTDKRFAPLIMVLGHGSISANNPFSAAYNCGACGGREGGPNARLLARLANNTEVRERLKSHHGISIPDDTVFIGGVHNTTAESVVFYDLDLLPESHKQQFEQAQLMIAKVRGENALERCRRFLLADVHTPEEALWYVQTRSNDDAEVRPELNHATNAAVVVGRRKLTKGRFLDRRVFLPSYDPTNDNAIGSNLERVLAPALIVCSGINLEYLFSTIDPHHSAGTKAPLNIVGNIGVLQGTASDLKMGLPTQMTEMHTPIRALYVVDAPIERVEAVLGRRKDLRQLVRNEWVRFIVRDPSTNLFYLQSRGEYLPISPQQTESFVPSTPHIEHGMKIAGRESIMHGTATAGMVLSCALPIYMFGTTAMNPLGPVIAICGTALSLPTLAFARRYLHGEFMYGRFSFLCVGLTTGFNFIAMAPSLEQALQGWALFGFSSVFLIGSYNGRPSVVNNATYAFAVYQVSDLAMLVAATWSAHHAVHHPVADGEHQVAVVAGLLLAALFKSSQFPLTSLFVRSMEGPTPASALGYAGLSAHMGVVLLTGTMPLWFGFDLARLTVGSIGIITATYGSLVAKIRADRKGALANACSATIGLIFFTVALGYPDLALAMSLGHASFRMIQVLRSSNVIADCHKIRDALGYTPWPKVVEEWKYRIGWRCNRFHTDFHMLHVLHVISRAVGVRFAGKPYKLTKFQQYLMTGLTCGLVAAPFTPLYYFKEEILMNLLQTEPFLALAIMASHYACSVVLIRFLFLKVLDARRFRRPAVKRINQSLPKSAPKET